MPNAARLMLICRQPQEQRRWMRQSGRRCIGLPARMTWGAGIEAEVPFNNTNEAEPSER